MIPRLKDIFQISKEDKEDIAKFYRTIGMGFLYVTGTFLLLGAAGSVLLVIVIVALFLIYIALRMLVWVPNLMVSGFAAVIKRIKRIEIPRLPEIPKRLPTKREIAKWLAGEYQENERLLNEAPLGKDERTAGKRHAKRIYIEKLNRIIEGSEE